MSKNIIAREYPIQAFLLNREYNRVLRGIKQREPANGGLLFAGYRVSYMDAVTMSRIADEREIEPNRRKIDYFRLLPEERISSILFPATSITWEVFQTDGSPQKYPDGFRGISNVDIILIKL